MSKRPIKVYELDELKNKDMTILKKGDTVWHPKWGVATVLSIRRRNGGIHLKNAEALIRVHKHPNLKNKQTHITRWVMARKLRAVK